MPMFRRALIFKVTGDAIFELAGHNPLHPDAAICIIGCWHCA